MARKTPLPAWLQDAVQDRVLTSRQARRFNAVLKSPENLNKPLAIMPPELWPVCQRLHLWEAESPSQLQH